MPPKDKYTDPELRDQVKQEIHESDKGGAPGQWSARKAQMMAQEYKKRGGTYNTDKSAQDESQANLSQWTEEEWQTKDGEGKAKQEDGTEKRYLPKKAWEQMDDGEKEATEEKKLEGSKEGKQFVGNTETAKESRKKVNEEEGEEHAKKRGERKANGKQTGDEGGQEEGDEAEDDDDVEPDAAAADDDEEEFQDDSDADDDEDDAEDDAADDDAAEEKKEDDVKEETANPGQKRKNTSQQSNGNSKKPKSNTSGKKSSNKSGTSNAPNGKTGSMHQPDDAPAPRGSADRLPKVDEKITWKAMPGFVDGTVLEVLTKGKQVDGKSVKASEDDPKLVLSSEKSGKICVHKPDACFYE